MLSNECTRNCWLAAAVAGLLVWIFNASFAGGLVMGLVAFLLLGGLLVWLVCDGQASDDTPAAAPVPAGDSVLERAEQAVVDASQAFAAGTVAAVEKGREAYRDMRRGGDDTGGSGGGALDGSEERFDKAGAEVKAAMGALAARGKDPAAAGKGPVTATATATAADVGGGQVSPSGEAAVQTDTRAGDGAKPAADDLKEIKGVGPALEGVLHENGVTRFAQIAAWDEADIDRYATLIGRMGGRIRSDDWVGQAKSLAANKGEAG